MKNKFKRLLTVFAFGIVTVTSALSLVGCSCKKNDRFDKPTLADYLRKKILFAIKNNPDFGGVSFGDVWNDTDLIKLAVRLINQFIAEYFYGSSFRTWAAWTGLTDNFEQDFFANLFRNWIFNLAGDKLYRDYLNAFAQSSFMEYSMPVANENIYFDPVPTSANHTHQGLEWALPEVPYYKVDGTPLPYSAIDSSFKLDRKQIKARIGQLEINRLKQELEYSLRDRFNYQLVPAVIDTAFSPVFLRLKLLAHYVSTTAEKTSNQVFIDRYSGLFFNMMNWSTLDLSNPKIKSNFLMVWQYRVKSEYINQINAVISTYSQPGQVLTGQKWTPTDYQDFVTTKLHQIAGQTVEDYNKKGNDPVFGVPHFQGFVAYNNSGRIVNDFSPQFYGEQLKAVAKAGFLQHNSGNYAFVEKAGASYADFAFVLPIYVPDILSVDNPGSSLNFGKQHKAAIELKNYYDGEAYPEDLSWQGLGTSNGRSVDYLRRPRFSTKPQATWGSYATDGTTQLYEKDGRINPTVDWTNFNLLKWAIYSFGQDHDLTEIVKTRFYSIAFNYSRKNLYSQKLYDMIGKYIEEKK